MENHSLKLYGTQVHFEIFQGLVSNEKRDRETHIVADRRGADAITQTTQCFWIKDNSADVHVNWNAGVLPFKPEHEIKAIRAINTKTGKSTWVAVKNISANSEYLFKTGGTFMRALDLKTYGNYALYLFVLIGGILGWNISGNGFVDTLTGTFFWMGLGAIVGAIPMLITNVVQNVPSFKKYEKKLSELMASS